MVRARFLKAENCKATSTARRVRRLLQTVPIRLITNAVALPMVTGLEGRKVGADRD